ncbi:MAG: hypothetical protein VKJ06_01835 [Vampirovibrionales bacterium]|nr:hypothetical protein [Vampirovibrionales bacterium]
MVWQKLTQPPEGLAQKTLFVGVDLAPNASLESGLTVLDRGIALLRADKLYHDRDIADALLALSPRASVVVVINMAKNLVVDSRWRVEQVRSRTLLTRHDALPPATSAASRFSRISADGSALFPGWQSPPLLPEKSLTEAKRASGGIRGTDDLSEDDDDLGELPEKSTSKPKWQPAWQAGGRFGKPVFKDNPAEKPDKLYERYNRRAKLLYNAIAPAIHAAGGQVLLTFGHWGRAAFGLDVPFRARSQQGCRMLQTLLAQKLQVKLPGADKSQLATPLLDAIICAYSGWLLHSGDHQEHYQLLKSEDGYYFCQPVSSFYLQAKPRRRLTRRKSYAFAKHDKKKP